MMKKRLLLLPLLAGLTLAGCEFTIGGNKITIGGKKDKNGEIQKNPYIMNEFQDYKLAKEVKDGQRYLLGVYRQKENLMRFVNGKMHEDNNGSYPYYMGTISGTTNGAAEIEAHVSGSTFSLQVHAPGEVWDGKYIGVYPATSSFNNSVMSIALLDDPDQTLYTPLNGGSQVGTSGKFTYYESYDGREAYAPAILFKYPGLDEEKVPKFLGTGHVSDIDLEKGEDDYISVDCKSYEIALDPEAYDLAHLYVKK